jgi:hypothetical protein
VVADPVVEPHIAQRLEHRDPVGGARRPEDAAAGEPAGRDHLADGRGHATAGAHPLRHIADPRPVLEPALRHVEQLDRAREQRDQAQHRTDEGGFAGTVRAQDGDDLARLDPQRDVPQDLAAAVGDRSVADPDDAHEVHPRAEVRASRLLRMIEK